MNQHLPIRASTASFFARMIASPRFLRPARRHAWATLCATFLFASALTVQADEDPASPTSPVAAAGEQKSSELPELPPEKDERGGKRREDYKQDHKGRSDRYDEMEVLDRLLAMPADHLARVRHAIEQIEAMQPEEREALRDRLNAFRKISPEDRQKMREKWRKLTPEERHEHVKKMRERRWDDVFKPEDNGDKREDECEKTEDAPDQ